MAKRRYRRKSKKNLSAIEWAVLIGILLYALTKKVLLFIQQFILDLQYRIQQFTLFDWIIIVIILLSLIFIIHSFINIKNARSRKKIEENKEKRADEARLRLSRDAEYQNLVNMDPYDFEKYVADLFMIRGYEVELTPRTGDGGKDIILRKDGEIHIVECKRYNENHKVSRPAIQKFHSALIDMNAKEGFFVTTSYFTQPAMQYTINKPIRLIDLPRLIEMIEESKGK